MGVVVEDDGGKQDCVLSGTTRLHIPSPPVMTLKDRAACLLVPVVSRQTIGPLFVLPVLPNFTLRTLPIVDVCDCGDRGYCKGPPSRRVLACSFAVWRKLDMRKRLLPEVVVG